MKNKGARWIRSKVQANQMQTTTQLRRQRARGRAPPAGRHLPVLCSPLASSATQKNSRAASPDPDLSPPLLRAPAGPADVSLPLPAAKTRDASAVPCYS